MWVNVGGLLSIASYLLPQKGTDGPLTGPAGQHLTTSPPVSPTSTTFISLLHATAATNLQPHDDISKTHEEDVINNNSTWRLSLATYTTYNLLRDLTALQFISSGQSDESSLRMNDNDMTMKPNDNDVLSGRGAWFNQHPGNTQFRRMLDEQKVSEPQQLYPRLPFVVTDNW